MSFYVSNIIKGLDFLEREDGCLDLRDPDGRQKIVDLLIQVRLNEAKYPDMYQVVSAQDSRFFAYQVIAKSLFERREQRELSELELLRYPHTNQIKSRSDLFARFPSLYLTKKEVENVFAASDSESDNSRFAINDTLPEISSELISANFSMETCVSLDSALFVFVNGRSVATFTEKADHSSFSHFLRGLFESGGIRKESYEPHLERLIEAIPKSSYGIINQVFLPKDKIENYLYMSFGGGFYHPYQDEAIHEVYSKYQSDRNRPDFMIDENIQCRLIAGSLLDDQVKIQRHSLIPDAEIISYTHLVSQVLDVIFREE